MAVVLALAGVLPLAGPLLIEDATSTAYVPQGWRASVDSHDNLILRQDEG